MPAPAVDYESTSATRKNFRAVLDAAGRGKAVTIRRGDEIAAVMPAERLREHLFHTVAPRAHTFFEDGRWVVLLADRPFVSEGATVEEAISDLVLSLREYAQDWDDRLRAAPNHEPNWALVQLINLSTDDELGDWIERGGW